MKIKITALLLPVLFLISSARGQTLEEINFSTVTQNISTYVTAINNAGFVCGYYDSSGQTNGFVINAEGKIIRFAGSPTKSVKVEGINNLNVVVINSTIAGVPTIFKAYYDTTNRNYSPMVPVSNVQESSAIPYGINNLNDVVGWYQGPNDRWLWVAHDSIVPAGTTAWMASRYETGGPQTFYNSEGTGINDNNIAVGFWFSGNTITPLLYDATANSVTTVSNAPSTETRLWGINNNNIAVGEYRQKNGTYMGFYAPLTSAGRFTMIHSLNTIFQSNTISSVARGINGKGEIVGSYLSPNTQTWVGFIYRPLTNEYRLPGFDFTTQTWGMKNNTNPAIGAWTANYYGGFTYKTTDPFANNGKPTIDQWLKTMLLPAFVNHPRLNSICADWRSFAQEVDNNNILSQPLNYPVWKRTQFYKMVTNSSYGVNFSGICYGFAYTTLMKYINDSLLLTNFGIPLGTNLYNVPNTNSGAVTAITRTYLKQYDPVHLEPFLVKHRKLMNPWNGLYRLKNVYLDPIATRRNPRAVYISLKNANNSFGWHELLPYKIHTPKMLPFSYNGSTALDTMFVYDSNSPKDSTQNFTIKSTSVNLPNDSAWNKSYPNLGEVCFNETGIREMIPVIHSALKTLGSHVPSKAAGGFPTPFLLVNYPPDTVLNYSIPGSAYYTISGTGGMMAIYNATTSSNNIPYLTEVEQKDTGITRPRFYNIDTAHSVGVTSYNYIDSSMLWSITDKHHVLGISRIALPAETDYGTWKGRTMSYGTHDAVTKKVNGYFMEIDEDPTHGVNIMASDMTMNSGDSILTENPSPFVYKITRFGSTSDKYDLWVYMSGADSLREFKMSGVTIGANTTHTIMPYSGAGNKQVVILVDKGNKGTVDTTITVTQAPLGVNDGKLPEGYVTFYPNPAHKVLTIAFRENLSDGCTIVVNDMDGRTLINNAVLSNTHEMHIPLGELPAGTYFIQVLNSMGVPIFTNKFIKE